MSSQMVYLCVDADKISPLVERAIQRSDPEKLVMLSQNIQRGDRLLTSWMEEKGGRVLLFHGDELYAECPGEHLAELAKVHERLQDAWDDTISIGVGLDLSEAKKALEAGKKQGGGRITFYAPEIDTMTSDEESASESHVGKTPDADPNSLKELELSKSNSPSPGPPTPNDPTAQVGSPFSAPQPSSGSAMPPSPSKTNAAAGLSPVEDQFRQMAHQGEAQNARAEGQANAAANGQTATPGDTNQLKAQIAKILGMLKEQLPILQQIKSQAPDTYKAILGMVQAMTMMAKQLVGDGHAEQDGQPTPTPAEEGSDKSGEVAKSESPLDKAYLASADVVYAHEGIDNQVKVQDNAFDKSGKTEIEETKPVPTGSTLSKIRKASMKMQKDLPMPEATNKMPPKPNGAMVGKIDGNTTPQVFREFHQDPGQAAHVGMDGKLEGKTSYRRWHSGKIKPDNKAEHTTGKGHPVSALNPVDR